MIIIAEIRRTWCWSNSYKRSLNSDLFAVERVTDRQRQKLRDRERKRQRRRKQRGRETERKKDRTWNGF